MSGYPGKMNPKLRAHLNATMGRFVAKIQRREKSMLLRVVALYACVRLAHQKCNDELEKRFWKWKLEELEAFAEKLKQAELRRRENIG